MARKRKAEEDEREVAAKHRQAVATASQQLVEAFKRFTTHLAQAENVSAMVQERMATMKTKIIR